jgi:hypothetical protein
MTTSITGSIYRDDPVDHVLTITNTHGRHYKCANCAGRIFTSDHDCLENFINAHEECEKKND